MRKAFWLLYAVMVVLVLSACTWDFSSCEHGEKKCNGRTLLSCSLEGDWLETLTCPSTQFCNTDVGCVECRDNDDCSKSMPVCNTETLNCQPADAICSQGQIKCEGNTLLTCNAAQNGFDETNCVEPTPKCTPNRGCVECANALDCKDPTPLCNLNKNKCQRRDAVCSEGETGCAKNKFLRCNAAQSGFDTTVCSGSEVFCNGRLGCVGCRDDLDCGPVRPICNEATKTCRAKVVCAEGETRCEGSYFMKCNVTQSGFEKTFCANICDTSKGCIGCRDNNDCEDPIKSVCNRETNVCENVAAVCAKNQTKCEDNTYMTCNATQSGFDAKVCSGSKPYCDGAEGCIECRDNADCKDKTKSECYGNTHTCQELGGVCTIGETKCERGRFSQCVTGQWGIIKCTTTSPVCDATKGCVECRESKDCQTPSKPTCSSDNTCTA